MIPLTPSRAARVALPAIGALLLACSNAAETAPAPGAERPQGVPPTAERLVVAGGCFWCVESDFEALPAVYEAVSGFAGGEKRDATYRDHEGHREAVEIWYDPAKTDYRTLVDYFLRTVDVTDDGGQFCDRGYAYTTAIYPETDGEVRIARAEISEAEEALGKRVVTPVERLPFFVAAEPYHQDYYKSEDRILSRFGYVTKAYAYKGYREGCGRDRRLEAVWGDAANLPAGKT